MKKEVLWGTDEEINNYMFDLFEHLILEVFSDQNEYNLDIEKYLGVSQSLCKPSN